MNIDGSSDPFYRYKMPEIEMSHIVRKKRTYIHNLEEISKSLNRDSDMIKNYMKRKLNTGAKYVSGGSKNKILEINGILQKEELYKCLRNFIDEFIICSVCGNPETEIYIKKNKFALVCEACGKRIIKYFQ